MGGCGWVGSVDARMPACHYLKLCGCFGVLLVVLGVTKHIGYAMLQQLPGLVWHLDLLVVQPLLLYVPGVSCLVVGHHADSLLNMQCPHPDKPLLVVVVVVVVG